MKVAIQFTPLGRELALNTLDWLAAGGDGKFQFYMPDWIEHTSDGSCGTVCCIGGHMELHLQGSTKGRRPSPENFNPMVFDAKDKREGAAMAAALFYANSERHLDDVTAADAAVQLRCALEKGYVDWSKAAP